MKFVHTNLIARDWRALAAFYEQALGCTPVLPGRGLSGDWLDAATGLANARIEGMHLRLPGWGDDGPTIEIFTYRNMPDVPPAHANTPGFSHIAFAVEDVEAAAQTIAAHGGGAIGERVKTHVEGVGLLTFQYCTDPEGNIIELQHWQRA